MSSDSHNGQLLKDIEEVSKALYLKEVPPKSVSRTSASVSTQSSVQGTKDIGFLPNTKKKSLVAWDWKRPLKAIAHFGQRRFDVCFLLHVHSIEGLPSNMDGDKLVVRWKRKDEVISTQPSKVLRGAAEFEETLTHICSVYVSKHGPHRSAKYEMKLFTIYVSPVDAPWLVKGKHLIDLTKISPLSVEELEGTRSTRKWNTSVKLLGLGDSAVLNLSLDYSVVTDSVCDSASGNVMLRRVGSVPSMDRRSSPLDDGNIFRQSSENLNLDLSQSIDFLYEKLNEQSPKTSAGIDIQCEHPGETKVDKGKETCMQAENSDDTEFAFTEKRVDMFQEDIIDPSIESSRIEIIDVHEILKDEEASFLEEPRFVDHLSLHKHSDFEEVKSAFSGSESFDIKSSSAMDDSTEKEFFLEVKSSYKAAKISTKSLSLDAITESIANDFLNMLELEDGSNIYTSDGEPTSPREYLLQEFEKEALAFGKSPLDIDGEAECASDIDEESNDFTFSSSSLGVKENKREGKTQLLINRRDKVLEDLENETLLLEDSLCVCSDGFGSPIELPVDEGLDFLPVEDNIGLFVRT